MESTVSPYQYSKHGLYRGSILSTCLLNFYVQAFEVYLPRPFPGDALQHLTCLGLAFALIEYPNI